MTGFDWLLNGLKRELRSREGPGRRRQRRPELPSHRVVVPSLFFFVFFSKYRIAVASPLVAAHLSHRRARRRATTTRTAHNRRRFTAVDAPVGVDDSDSIICFFFYLFFLRHPFQPVSRFVHSCFLVFYFVFLFIFLGGWKAKERRTINKRTDGNKSSRLNGQLIATSEARLKEAAKEENTHREREREREREKENGWNEKRATRWSVPALRPDRSAPNRHLGLAASSTGLDCLLWLRAVHGVDHLKAGSPIPRLNSVETR